MVIYCLVNRIGAKLKAELEGNTEQVTCMDRLHYQCKSVVPEVGGTTHLGAVRNSRGVVKQK